MNNGLFKTHEDVEKKINEACGNLKSGNFVLAVNIFQELLINGIDSIEVDTGIKCAKYWLNRIDNINKMTKGLDRGKYLLKEWEGFENFFQESAIEGKLYDIKIVELAGQYIIAFAVEDLVEAYKSLNYPDIDLLIKIGESFILLYDYHKAIETLEYVRTYRKKDPYILSLLADCYYGYGEVRRAKVLFREAFFLGPEVIPIKKIKCSIINDILSEIKKSGHSNVQAWIPVFGIINNYFDIKKELSDEEVEQLIKEIKRIENEYYTKMNKHYLPYLLSKYLYFIDYLETQTNELDEIVNIKNKIRAVSPDIYEKYIQNRNQ